MTFEHGLAASQALPIAGREQLWVSRITPKLPHGPLMRPRPALLGARIIRLLSRLFGKCAKIGRIAIAHVRPRFARSSFVRMSIMARDLSATHAVSANRR